MTTITSHLSAGEASFLLGWALYERLAIDYDGRVQFPFDDTHWLAEPGHTIYIPIGTAIEHVDTMLPALRAEITSQIPTATDDWYIALDYWAHAMSGDSERISDGIRFDVVVQVRG
ncbi:hypothetical protein [Microbacterium sp.]|uniref:hypothetical protein n=1 Tax=Microbacterium sp. TaxID=51671 RepID=UPI003A8D45BC